MAFSIIMVCRRPLNVLFVNCGHSHTSAFVVSFVKGKLRVLSECTTHAISGRALDMVLMEYCAKVFEKKEKMNPLENKKARYIGGKECSAVSGAYQILLRRTPPK